MAINWFEGGRRIISLMAGLIMFGGAIYLLSGEGDHSVILESASPDEHFHWTLVRCEYPAMQKDWDGETTFPNGAVRQVTACFRTNSDGNIVIRYGPEKSVPATPEPGARALPSMRLQEVFVSPPYKPEAETYALDRMRSFSFSHQEWKSIGDGMWKIGVVRFCERAIEVFPWIAGFLIGLWAIASCLGWLIRGFANIPARQDFRADDQAKAASGNRASLDWLWMAIVGWGLMGAISWLILKAMTTPATSALGQFASKAFGVLGSVVLTALFFSLAVIGAIGFRGLFFTVLRREQPMLDDDAESRALVLFGLANIAVLAAISWLLNSYTVIGTWTDGLDKWSRANGYADGGLLGLFVLCLLWPLPPLYALRKLAKSDVIGARDG